MNNNTTVTDNFAAARAYIHESLNSYKNNKNSHNDSKDLNMDQIQAKIHALFKRALIVTEVAKVTDIVEVKDNNEVVTTIKEQNKELAAREEERLAELKEEYSHINRAITVVYNKLFDGFADKFEEFADDVTPEQLEELIAADKYEGDDRDFRKALNESVNEVKNLVPAWGGYRQFVFLKLYDCISKILSVRLRHEVDFTDKYFERQFLPYVKKRGLTAPFDIWRRIHLCARSQIWKDITIAAFRQLAEVAILDEAMRCSIDVNKASKFILGRELD